MKKKIVGLFVLFVVCVFCVFGLVACESANNENTNENPLGLDFYMVSYDAYGVSVGDALYSEKIVIPKEYNGKPVTKILPDGFKGTKHLKELVITDKITCIESEAFKDSTVESVFFTGDINSWVQIEGLSNLLRYGRSNKEVYISGELLTSANVTTATKVSENAFYNCSSLVCVTIGNSVESIGSGAFSGCSSLESMTIPFVGAKAGVKSTDTYQYPFGYMFGTNSYAGGESIRQYYYGSSTSSTTYSNYYIPSSLKTVTVTGGDILYGAFYNCSALQSITIPEVVTNIENFAFYGCSSLTSIEIPNSVTNIGNSVFSGCTALTSVTMPEVVTRIGKSVFNECTSLTSIVFEDTANWYRTSNSGFTGGSLISVTDSTTNATYFKSTYKDYYWYKKIN